MDRLISEKKVFKILTTLFLSDERFKTAINSIRAIPSAYKGMTNGEVIKTVFNTKIIDGRYLWESLKVIICGEDDSWWNSPYSERSDKE